MNKLLKTNILLAAGLAVDCVLVMYPLGMLYMFAIIIFTKLIWILAIVMAVCSYIVYIDVKCNEYTGSVLLLFGAAGGVIAVNTVNRGYEGRGRIYTGLCGMIWIFLIYPGVIYLLITYGDWWLPSV